MLFLFNCSKPPEFNSQRAYDDLIRQCDFGPRIPNSEAHLKAGEFLYNNLKSSTEYCRVQKFAYFDSSTSKELQLFNIIASFRPEDSRRIMLCAHWDSRPRCDQDADSNYWHAPLMGANDGASGVAILLEIGRLLKTRKPSIGVDIVLFDGEDYGLSKEKEGWFLGSSYFSENLGLYRPRLAILLDMVGDSSLQIYREGYSEKYSKEINDYIWEIADEAGIKEFSDSVKYTVSDDHVPLISRGLRAIDIIDFDYPYWHTHNDTPDKCSPASLGKVGKVILTAIFDKRIKKF